MAKCIFFAPLSRHRKYGSRPYFGYPAKYRVNPYDVLRMTSNQECISVFSSPWWLDATAGPGNWSVAEVKEGVQVVASMPWVLKQNRLGLKILSQPALTQTLGPWISEPSKKTKYATKLAREKDLMAALIDQLPKYHVFKQNFAPEITNWLPFYWRGFRQTTRYTYRLDSLDSADLLWKNFQENTRWEIRKAEKKGVFVEATDDIEAFLLVNEKTFLRQGMKPPYSYDYVRKLYSACLANGAGKIFLAKGADGRVHAGNLIVWNQHCAYYLMGGGDPELRNSGATSLSMWHAIQFASTVSRIFDFEGSMIEPVERFFRGFGAVQTPYFSLTHVRSKRAATALGLRSALGALLR